MLWITASMRCWSSLFLLSALVSCCWVCTREVMSRPSDCTSTRVPWSSKSPLCTHSCHCSPPPGVRRRCSVTASGARAVMFAKGSGAWAAMGNCCRRQQPLESTSLSRPRWLQSLSLAKVTVPSGRQRRTMSVWVLSTAQQFASCSGCCDCSSSRSRCRMRASSRSRSRCRSCSAR